ncbi:hypothetical protein NDN08_001773 [Rhodosorus marinus]|uniref:Ammonium transporter AmtB-like domain-containing protein n=1 Tax=Rhodosorus marinus TaxID=101924 RepID=A0AAV8URT1_9RHOD|nr:hypothetical protein NDN08_001772 [Rhodosorus marinus]KAJ8905265.1 hypothetical protein NDN08_001773 [Rhodosorus marinus]
MSLEEQTREAEIDVDVDIEEQKQGNLGSNARLLVTAGVFAFVSYLVMNEGAVRSTLVGTPEPAAFNQTLLLVAACGEILFGLAGVILAAALALFRYGSKMITTGWLIMAFVLGWFVFTVWVLAQPIFNIANIREVPEGLPLTLSQYDAFRTYGLLAGITWCFALQGGQFMVGNVIRAMQATGKSKGVGYSKIRLTMWSSNLALSGLFFLIGGSIIRANVGPGPYDAPVVSEPMVIIYPGLTITAGVFQLIGGLMGIVVAYKKEWFAACGAALGFLWMGTLASAVWPQTFIAGAAVGTTLLAGLSAVTFSNVAYSIHEYKMDLDEELQA